MAPGRRAPAGVELLKHHHATCGPKPTDDGIAYVIRQDSGKPLDPDNWHRRVWPTIRKAAKLPSTVSLHVLRHTFGSLLLADNTPIKHVSSQVGHGNVGITMDIYAHTLKSTSAKATR